ncbi:hypothetical protein PMAYCL1PPCAC_18327, partial [Pristionchus mayeri]
MDSRSMNKKMEKATDDNGSSTRDPTEESRAVANLNHEDSGSTETKHVVREEPQEADDDDIICIGEGEQGVATRKRQQVGGGLPSCSKEKKNRVEVKRPLSE